MFREFFHNQTRKVKSLIILIYLPTAPLALACIEADVPFSHFGNIGTWLILILMIFQDPEIAAAFKDIQQNPANMLKHQSNPKVAAFMMKMATKLGGGGGLGGMMGGLGGMMGGLGGMFGGMGGGGGGAAPTQDGPAAPADIDID